MGPFLMVPRGIVEIPSCHRCKTGAEENACIPTPGLSGVEDSSGVLGCPGILLTWWGWQKVKYRHSNFGDNSFTSSG